MKTNKFLVYFSLAFALGCSDQSFQTVETKGSFSAEATYQAEVDVLWVIDNSYSTMEDHQIRISNYMNGFYQNLIQNKADFRIAATTMDTRPTAEDGDLVGETPIITKSTPNAVSRLKSLLVRGGNGSSYERGLDAMIRALEKQKTKGQSAEFLREEAVLVVVFLTDDRDFSNNNVQDAVRFLNELKGENTDQKQNWIVNYVGITDLNDPKCRTYKNYTAIGQRYVELAEASGGVIDSICYTDFSSYLDQVTVRLKSILNEYKLEKKPILDSLTVYKNGALVRKDNVDGWSYDSLRNSVFLNGEAKPNANDDIEIKYEIGN